MRQPNSNIFQLWGSLKPSPNKQANYSIMFPAKITPSSDRLCFCKSLSENLTSDRDRAERTLQFKQNLLVRLVVTQRTVYFLSTKKVEEAIRSCLEHYLNRSLNYTIQIPYPNFHDYVRLTWMEFKSCRRG